MSDRHTSAGQLWLREFITSIQSELPFGSENSILDSGRKPERAQQTHTDLCSCKLHKGRPELGSHLLAWGSALTRDYSTKSEPQPMDTFHFSCNLIVIKVSIISTKFPHFGFVQRGISSAQLRLQVTDLLQTSHFHQRCSITLVLWSDFHLVANIATKTPWSQLVKVVLKHVEFSRPLPSLWEQMWCAEMKEAQGSCWWLADLHRCDSWADQLYKKSTQVVTNETY